MRILILLLCWSSLAAQYVPPLRGELRITGTFGELRSDHFHAGLDFRAAVGTPVYAVGGGYISRIRISGGGYGQAIYVDHPDGKRSVYAHLEALTPRLRDTVRALQYANERFELDYRPDSLAFPVARGEPIGSVGNRGFSFGPHLHFEIRESATDAPVNPLSLGFAVVDTRAPVLQQLQLYTLGVTNRPGRAETYDLVAGQLPDTLRVASRRIGLGLKAFDRQDAMPNRNGIYRVALYVDEKLTYAFTYDRIPYEQTEYLNALTDYAAWKERSSWYYLLFARTPRAVFWTDTLTTDGTIDLTVGRPRRVQLRVQDYAGNEAERSFILLAEGPPPAAPPPVVWGRYALPAGEESVIDTGELYLHLPAAALYEDLLMDYVYLPDSSAGQVSATHQLHDARTPLHGQATLKLTPTVGLSDTLGARVFVGRCGEDGTFRSVGGRWEEDRMVAEISTFGRYALRLDTVAPVIRIEQFRTDLRGQRGFSVLVEEESGGGIDYRGEVDGDWVLLEYDAKRGQLRHDFADGAIGPGQHTFTLRVSDRRGNVATLRRPFRR